MKDIYEETFDVRGWFAPQLTLPGWFDRDLVEPLAALVSPITVVGHTSDPSSPTAEAMGTHVVAKKVTLVAGDFVASIAAYVDYSTPGDTWGLHAVLYTDNAGDPSHIEATGSTCNMVLTTSLGVVGAARWLHVPLGYLVETSGDYWLAVYKGVIGGQTGDCRIYYEGSGTDRTWEPGGAYVVDWDYSGVSSKTTTSNDYLIRGLVY